MRQPLRNGQPAMNLPANPTSEKFGANPYASLGFGDLQFNPGATFDQRLIALTLDFLFLAFINKGLESLLSSLGGSSEGLGIIIVLSYFVGMQWWYGFTIGKYFAGIRLVVENSRTASSFSRIFFRETVGKVLSLLPLGYGFISLFFSIEGMCWHDRLSHTKVISLREVQSSVGKQLFRGALALMSLLILVIGVGAVTLLMTSVPLENLQQRLTWAGIHLSGIEGNMLRGYRVSQVQWQRDGNKVLLKNIRAKIDPWSFLKQKGNVRVQSLSVESGEIHVTSMSEAPQARDEDGDDGDNESFVQSLSRSISFDILDVSKVIVHWGKTDLQVDRFFVSDFRANETEFKFGRLYVDSSKFQFDVSRFQMRDGVIEMPTPVQGTVKVGLDPDLVKADFVFQAKAWGRRDRPNFEVSAFNSQFKISRKENQTKIETSDLSLANYLKGYWAMSRLNLKIENQAPANADSEEKPNFEQWQIAGDFRLHPALIKISEGQSLSSAMQDGIKGENWQNGEKYSLLMKPHLFQSPDAWAQFSKGGQRLPMPETLAQIKNGKALMELNDTDRDLVQKDVEFFSKSLLGLEGFWQNAIKPREPAAVKSTQLKIEKTPTQDADIEAIDNDSDLKVEASSEDGPGDEGLREPASTTDSSEMDMDPIDNSDPNSPDSEP